MNLDVRTGVTSRHAPGLLHQRVVRSYIWLARDNIKPRTPDPALAQRRRKRV